MIVFDHLQNDLLKLARAIVEVVNMVHHLNFNLRGILLIDWIRTLILEISIREAFWLLWRIARFLFGFEHDYFLFVLNIIFLIRLPIDLLYSLWLWLFGVLIA